MKRKKKISPEAAVFIVVAIIFVTGMIFVMTGQSDEDITNVESIPYTAGYAKDDYGRDFVPFYDAAQDEEYSWLVDPESGEYVKEPDGFYVGEVYVDFESLRKYDWICDVMEKINEKSEMDIENNLCIFKPLGNEAAAFSAEIEERLRQSDSGTVALPFNVEGVDDAVVFTMNFDEHRLLTGMSISLAGSENFTENGISLTFGDYGVNIINNGQVYSFSWDEDNILG